MLQPHGEKAAKRDNAKARVRRYACCRVYSLVVFVLFWVKSRGP